MSKINISAVPVVQPEIVGPLTYTVEDQGEFSFYLKEPDFPASLSILGTARERTEKWCAPGANRYPLEEFVQMSEELWTSVCILSGMQCGPGGEPLADADRYSEADLLQLSVRLPQVFFPLGQAAAALFQKAEERLGNALGGREVPSSAAASTTEPSVTPTASE